MSSWREVTRCTDCYYCINVHDKACPDGHSGDPVRDSEKTDARRFCFAIYAYFIAVTLLAQLHLSPLRGLLWLLYH